MDERLTELERRVDLLFDQVTKAFVLIQKLTGAVGKLADRLGVPRG